MPKKVERTDTQPRGLLPFGRAVVTGGCALLLFGLALGSFPYLVCALLLLGAAFAARGLQAPRIALARALSAQDVRTGDSVDVAVSVRNDGAAAGVLLHDAVPDPFLLEDGRNVEAAFLAPGEEGLVAYRLKAPRRGAHDVGPLRATAHDPLFLQSAQVAETTDVSALAVHPKTPPTPRIRTASAWGRGHTPGGDRATRGIRTNDFRELRPYERGDPLKAVNWKATARASTDELRLVVNDYEVEGKKVVWIFLDASAYTVGGTTSSSHFDELAHGALSVAGHYLDLGHRVGFTLFGSGQPRVLYADAGELQERRIAAAIGSAEPGEPGPGIGPAVEASKGFLAREKPYLFVFTLAGRDPDLPRALVSARALASTGRRPAPVVAVTPILEEDGSAAARIVAVHEKAQLKGIEKRGVTVMRYHPSKVPIQALLARGVIR